MPSNVSMQVPKVYYHASRNILLIQSQMIQSTCLLGVRRKKKGNKSRIPTLCSCPRSACACQMTSLGCDSSLPRSVHCEKSFKYHRSYIRSWPYPLHCTAVDAHNHTPRFGKLDPVMAMGLSLDWIYPTKSDQVVEPAE